MFIEFEKDYLLELYRNGSSSDKKHRYQPSVIRGYQKVVSILSMAKRIEDLFQFNSLNYEVLDGDKKGLSSVRINRQYRLEFKVYNKDSVDIVTCCRLIDISNHYK